MRIKLNYDNIYLILKKEVCSMKNLFGISIFTLVCLYGLLAGIILAVFYFTGLPVMIGVYISIAIIILQFILSPWLTDFTMKLFYKVKFEDDMLPNNLKKFIKTVCEKENMKYPKIGYIDDGAPNAFTYGRTKNSARIIITRGTLEMLNASEAMAVIAHELGHARHYDMLFMTVAQLVPLIMYGIYETTVNMDDNTNNDNSIMSALGLIALALYFISQYIILWLSRTREYYADSFAIEVTKDPSSLANALVKVGYGLSTSESNKKHNASKSNALGIFDSKTSKSLVVTSYKDGKVSKENIKETMKWEEWNIWAKVYELNSTHPLISKRLKAISDRCKEFNQKEFINFDLKKEESYVDDFIRDLIVYLMPFISLVLTILFIIIIPNKAMLITGIGGMLFTLSLLIKLLKSHKSIGFKERKVKDLLSIVKVSNINSVSCELKGKIIGRGNPGCILNEDFVLQDDTGIIFLDYNQPLNVINKVFALFKSKEYFDKEVTIKGWYRRNPVPYVEIKEMTYDNTTKTIHTFKIYKTLLFIILLVFIVITILSI